jgi:CRISP-associated protein Cas1
MTILYLTEQQAWVSKQDECLVVHVPTPAEPGKPTSQRGKERKKTVPIGNIEQVIVLGDITISTPALAVLLQRQVSITYLDRIGRYLGQLNPELTKNSLLRMAQHTAHSNPNRRFELARGFVLGKLRNMRTILLRYNRADATPDPVIGRQIEILKGCITSVERLTFGQPQVNIAEAYTPELEPGEIELGRMNGLGELLGCEGAGSAAYFGVFSRLLKCKWEHGFTRRVRRPPTDPVNALLSYGYTVLAGQVAANIATVGFDPYIGYLHSSRYGKTALALDLLEEFRPVIVDSVVLSLFNNRQLEPDSFEPELNSYRMKDATRKLFLTKFEERMQEVVTHPVFEYKVTYRRCIELQARLLAKYLQGEIKQYIPFTVR